VGPRLCLAAAWAAWTIKPTLNRNDEGPGFIPGLFLAPSHELSLFLLRVLLRENCVPVFLVGRGDRFLAFAPTIVGRYGGACLAALGLGHVITCFSLAFSCHWNSEDGFQPFRPIYGRIALGLPRPLMAVLHMGHLSVCQVVRYWPSYPRRQESQGSSQPPIRPRIG
jgi:hypothetical protein